MTFSPNHDKALQNRHRTSPMVDELDNNFLKKIDRKRDDLLDVPETSAGLRQGLFYDYIHLINLNSLFCWFRFLRRIKKEAYYQYIYHTLGNFLVV